MTGFSPTFAALFGSMATAAAIFGGGLVVEAYKRSRDRRGMALALAGAVDALLSLIETRDMVGELIGAHDRLEAGERVTFGSLVGQSQSFWTITMAQATRIGELGGELPFRVSRFLTFSEGLLQDLARLEQNADQPQLQAMLIRRMEPVWLQTEALGKQLVSDLREEAGFQKRRV